MQAADGLSLDCPPFGITDSHMTQIHRILCPIPFALKTVNCYYLSDTVPTLIDTGVDYGSNLEAIDRVIRETGGSLADLQRIILTHAHTDECIWPPKAVPFTKPTWFSITIITQGFP
jgi:hypothetical protein